MRRFFLIVLGVIFAVGVYAQHEKGELTVQPRVGAYRIGIRCRF